MGNNGPSRLRCSMSPMLFVDLQERRHVADYDNYRQWNVTQVQEVLESVEVAFVLWGTIRTDSMAGNYLLAMILSKQRV